MAAAAPESNVRRSITSGTTYGLSAADALSGIPRIPARGIRDTWHGAMASGERGGGTLFRRSGWAAVSLGRTCRCLKAAVSERFRRAPWF